MNLTRFLTSITQIKGHPPTAQPLIPPLLILPSLANSLSYCSFPPRSLCPLWPTLSSSPLWPLIPPLNLPLNCWICIDLLSLSLSLSLFDFSFSFNLYEKYCPKGQGKASNSASAKPSKQQVDFNINVRLLGYLKAHHRFLDMFISFHFYHNQWECLFNHLVK